GSTGGAGRMLAGYEGPVGRFVRDTLGTRAPKGEASLYLGREFASAPEAALANAVAGHALDYDDVALAGHPSVVLVPAILAEAEAVGASGMQAAAAYAAGYEVWARLGGRDQDGHPPQGLHPAAAQGAPAPPPRPAPRCAGSMPRRRPRRSAWRPRWRRASSPISAR